MKVAKRLHLAGRMAWSVVSRRPTLITAKLLVTFRCNLQCTYCNLPNLGIPELSTGQWLAVIDELADLGCRRVGFSGGEALVRQDLPELIARVKQRGMSCTLTSNGTLVARRVDWLKLLETLTISLDAPGPENDEVRGQGVFEAVKEGLAAARAAGIPVKLTSVLSTKTAHLLEELIAFVEDQDLDITVNFLRSETECIYGSAATIKAEDDSIRELAGRLALLARTNPRMLYSEATYRYAARWADFSRDRYEAGELPPHHPILREAPRCHAGRSFLTIRPDGAVFPCTPTLASINGGNVVTDGVEEAWRRLHDHRCLACFAPCLVEQNYLYSLNPRVLKQFVVRHLSRYS